MKTSQIHELNTLYILIFIEIFSSAVEYYLNQMVELKKSIWNEERVNIKFEEKTVEKVEELFSEIVSRYLIKKKLLQRSIGKDNFKLWREL